jgi:NADH-quinone oxidoreductase subunit M
MDAMGPYILSVLIGLPLVGALVIAFLPASARRTIQWTAMAASVLTFSVGLLALYLYYVSPTNEMPTTDGTWRLQSGKLLWIAAGDFQIVSYHVGVDGISLWLVLLTVLLVPVSIWGSFSGINERLRQYYALMLILETGLIGVFCAIDLLLFYVFFEFTLVPLYFIIGIWGGPERQAAANKFFIYTLAGSVLTFASILYIAYRAYGLTGDFSFDVPSLYGLNLTAREQWWLFWAMAAGFAIKVPLFPFHTWLPLAHTEAPTAGSVILAGVLLKLGTYGFLRFCVPILPDATLAIAPLAATICVIGIIYGALVAWVQQDIKKLVAYSSVSHLGFCMLGMFSLRPSGVVGAVLYMLNHGLSTGALFLVVGMIYERYHTRQIDRIGGLARRMPWMSFFLIFFVLSSIGLPGLNGFVSEFLVLLGVFTSNVSQDSLPDGPLAWPYAAFAATGIILSALYLLWMCQRVLFGPLKEPAGTPDTSRGLKADLTKREIALLTPIALACLWIGVFPKPLMQSIYPDVNRQVLEHVYHRPVLIAGQSPPAPDSLEDLLEAARGEDLEL